MKYDETHNIFIVVQPGGLDAESSEQHSKHTPKCGQDHQPAVANHQGAGCGGQHQLQV